MFFLTIIGLGWLYLVIGCLTKILWQRFKWVIRILDGGYDEKDVLIYAWAWPVFVSLLVCEQVGYLTHNQLRKIFNSLWPEI